MLVSYSHNNSICPRILTHFYLIRCWEARITWCSRFFGRSFCRLLSASRTVLKMGPLGAISGCEGCSIPTNLGYCYHTFGWSSGKNHHQQITQCSFQGRSQEIYIMFILLPLLLGILVMFTRVAGLEIRHFEGWLKWDMNQVAPWCLMLLTYACSIFLVKELVPTHIKHMVNLRQSSQLCERATTGCSFRMKRNHNETAQVLIPQMQNHLE